MVIDLFGLSESEVRKRYPEVYQHVLLAVKPDRLSQALKSTTADAQAYAQNWWIFGKPRTELRPALEGLSRYIVTVETAKHRVFQFLDSSIIPDNRLVVFALNDPADLGVLSSTVHVSWTLTLGAMLEDRPIYTKSLCFDPFPFPDATLEQRQIIGDLAQELDATRKEVLAEHTDLTLTGLYNLREKLRQHGPFTPVEQDQRRRGRVDIIAELHDRIDAAVADAYGWPRDLSDEAIVTRLVALNAERHAEEKAGKVRWLRPDYQLPRAGVTMLAPKVQNEQIEALLPAAAAKKPAFPRDAIGQTAAVLADLRGGAGLTSAEIARRYAQGLRAEPRIAATLAALVRLGHVAAEGDRYTLRRAA